MKPSQRKRKTSDDPYESSYRQALYNLGSVAIFEQRALTSYKLNGLTVFSIKGSFGAEIEGAEWEDVPIDQNVLATLINLQNKYAVLIFRYTNLDNDRQVPFSKQL